MRTSIVYQVPVDLRRALTSNQRLCWQERARRTSDLRMTGVIYARRAMVPLDGPGFTRAHLTVTFAWPDRRRRDPANWHPTLKALVDGSVDAGVLADDDGTRLVGPDLRVSDETSGRARVALLTFCWEGM
ncbi:MAG: hypothetical protein FWH11_01410 [Micrococcales bacterium]|nr:hypothetical protein [Micrococcales bacterium]